MRMVHQGQRLPLGLKTGYDRSRVHPRLDYLQRHLPADRTGLLRQKHDSKAPFSDLLDQGVGPDDCARLIRERRYLVAGSLAASAVQAALEDLSAEIMVDTTLTPAREG